MSETPCESAEAAQFDFWVGEWDLTWPAEQMGGEPSEVATGTNHIRRVLDGCVIEESFATGDATFQGRSWSVFVRSEGIWRQTWVDSSGGYIQFSGQFDGATMELRTAPRERDGALAINRMVFRDISADSLRWDWQGSKDGGGSWSDLWNIDYRRRG